LVVALATLVSAARTARAAIQRYAVLVGSNRGDSDEPELRYAESVAQRMGAVLREVGHFPPENSVILNGESATGVQRALIAVNDRIRAAQGIPGAQVVLFVYYSGHADAEALHLNGTRLELLAIDQLVRSSAAAFRVLVVDACRSGSLTRLKGGTPAPAFAVQVDETLDGEGTVFLTSSSANEDAQESDAVGGSFFTHYLRSGLLGPADADGDGSITLDEAYHYAHDNTLRASSRTLAGVQHPTYRYDLRGQGRLVLTEPLVSDGNRAQLRFPESIDYLVFLGEERGAVVGEVAAHDRARVLSVAPGAYFVRGRASTHLLEGTVQVKAGAVEEIDDAKLKRVDYARLVRKGGGVARLVHGPQAGYTVRTALGNSTGLCHGVFAGYGFALTSITIAPRVAACRGGYTNSSLSATVDTLDAGVRASHAWDLPLFSVELGARAGGSLYRQRFETQGVAPPRTTLGAQTALDVGVTVDVGAGVALFAESGAEAAVFALQRSPTKDREMSVSFAFRQNVGLAKWW
jgi:hypothetical protein